MTDLELTEWCARAGLRVRGVERRGAILLLKPQTLDDLPAPGDLRLLAEKLQVLEDVRWVALDIDESP